MYIMKFSMSTYPLHHHHAMSRREDLFHCHDNPIYAVTGDLRCDLWIELFAKQNNFNYDNLPKIQMSCTHSIIVLYEIKLPTVICRI